jgi:hypothetical protein
MVDKLFEAAQTFDKLDEEAMEKYKMGDPSDRSLEDSDFWIIQSEKMPKCTSNINSASSEVPIARK